VCSITDALSIVGDRYALLVARELRYGRTRFQDIAAGTGAPRDVLTARLKTGRRPDRSGDASDRRGRGDAGEAGEGVAAPDATITLLTSAKEGCCRVIAQVPRRSGRPSEATRHCIPSVR